MSYYTGKPSAVPEQTTTGITTGHAGKRKPITVSETRIFLVCESSNLLILFPFQKKIASV